MNKETLIKTLAKKNSGSWFNITWKSDLPLLKAAKDQNVTAYKMTSAQCRKEISYAAQKSVQAKVQRGYQLTHELPWGKWVEGYEGLLIENKGINYVRLYFGPNKSETKYYLNGKEVTYNDLKESGMIQNGYFNKKSSERPDCITVKVDNIQVIK